MKGELPSANMVANARSFARIASTMANKGQGEGSQETIMTEETWQKFHDKPETAYDVFLNITTNFSQGGINVYRQPDERLGLDGVWRMDNREGWFGWQGFGGS